MFAVIKTGGKQYRVAPGDIIDIEKLSAEVGSTVSFDSVLMCGGDGSVKVGTPFIDGAEVTGEVLAQFRGEKLVGMKKRRRKHSSARRWGHRQYLTKIIIAGIPGADGATVKADAEAFKAASAAAMATLSGEKPVHVKPDAADSADGAANGKKASKKKAASSAGAAGAAAGAATASASETAASDVTSQTSTTTETTSKTSTETTTLPPPSNLIGGDITDGGDFTVLPGVTPEVQAALNGMGVHYFYQMTEWSEDDWSYVEVYLQQQKGMTISRTEILSVATEQAAARGAIQRTETVTLSAPTNLIGGDITDGDDFTKLPGVTADGQKILNQSGVHYLTQMREWGPSDWEFIEAYLAQKSGGKIEIQSGSVLGQVTKILESRAAADDESKD